MQIGVGIACLLLIVMVYASPHQQLKEIDQKISAYRNKRGNSEQIHFEKLSHFHVPTNQPVRIYESIRLHTKMKSYPNVMIDTSNIYSIEGELLAPIPANSLFASIRNQNMLFLTQASSQLTIRDLVTKNKTAQLETVLVISGSESFATAFVTGGGLKTKSLFLVAYANGSIVRYSDKGEYKNQSDYIQGPILKFTKTLSYFYAQTQTEIHILELFRPLEQPICSFLSNKIIHNHFSRGDDIYIHQDQELITFSISKCQITKHHNVPIDCTINQLGDKILITKGNVAYFLNPLNDYSMGILNLKLPLLHSISTAKKSEFSTLISIYSPESNEVSVYEYSWEGQQQSFETKGFKIPVMLIIFGIILFYTYKNKKQKQGEVGNSTKEPVDSELEGLEKLSPEELQKMLEQIKSMEKNK